MSQISKQALQVENNTSFPNNNTGYISPAILRSYNVDVIDSTVNQSGYDLCLSDCDMYKCVNDHTFCGNEMVKIDKDIIVGIATDVCAGSTNADRTISCYSKAASTMNRGLAATLCSAKAKEE